MSSAGLDFVVSSTVTDSKLQYDQGVLSVSRSDVESKVVADKLEGTLVACDELKTDKISSNSDVITIDNDVVFTKGDARRALELSRFASVGSEEVYDRSKFDFYYGFNLNPFQKNQYLKEVQIASEPVSGTESYSDAPVYGYNEDGSIDPAGGKSNAYPSSFTEFKYKVHSPDDDEVFVTTSTNVLNVADSVFSYFKERGFPFVGDDKKGIAKTSYSDEGFGMDNFLEFKTVNGQRYLDLFYRSQPRRGGFLYGVEEYKEPADRKKYTCYPLRVPVTTSYDEHLELIGSDNDSVYYDLIKKIFTIKLSSQDHVYIDEDTTIAAVGSPSVRVYHSIKDLSASYAIVRRVASSKALESCVVENADAFVQIADITCSANIIQSLDGTLVGVNTTGYEPSVTRPVINGNGNFVGSVCPKAAGGDTRFDIFVTDPGDANGFATTLQGAPGDNPTTMPIEKGGDPTAFYVWSSPYWQYIFAYFSPEIQLNPPLPEMLDGNQTIKDGTLPTAPSSTILSLILGHEFQHCISFSIGGIRYMDSEAQATAVECDPRLNIGTIALFRPHAWLSYVLALHRGSWTAFANGRSLDDINVIYPDYGASMFYMYLQTTFDKNHQIMRRMNEIVSLKSFEPLTEEEVKAIYATRTRFTGAQLAFAQAIEEIYPGKTKDVFIDYCISTLLLRPNEAIPAQYRTGHPYWFWSSYSENNKNGELNGGSNDSRWWQDFDEAVVLEAEIGENSTDRTNPYRRVATDGPHFIGQTITPTWPKVNPADNSLDYNVNSTNPLATAVSKELMNMSMCAFLMPDSLNSATVQSTKGTLHVAALKFGSTADGVGTWLMDGVHVVLEGESKVIDLTQFHGQPGKTQLVVINNNIQEEPEPINNFIVNSDDPERLRISGKCTITVA